MSQNAYQRKSKRRRLLRDNRGQSQYITVMLLFSLGLAMVVAVNFLFEGLTESVQDTVARERLEEFTINVRDKIVQTIAIGQQSGQNSQVRTELHLPTKIGTKYDFEITLFSTSADNSDWIIISRVINTDTVLRFTIPLRVDSSRVTLDGSFSSTATQHFIIFRSSSRSGLSLDQCVLVDA